MKPVAIVIIGITVLAHFGNVSADPQPPEWLDPAGLPFVPTPIVIQALVADEAAENCMGTAVYSTGPVPEHVERVSVSVDVEKCRVIAATVSWTVGGDSYSADIDPVSGALEKIRITDYAVPMSYSECGAGSELQSTTGPCGGSGGGGGSSGSGGGPAWTHRTSHTWLHFWTKSGSGNENVIVNLNWRYAGLQYELTSWNNRCDADGVWRVDACTGTLTDGGRLATGKGDFHSIIWPYDYHSWKVTDQVNALQTTSGTCTPTGTLPWNYGSTCENGPGNV